MAATDTSRKRTKRQRLAALTPALVRAPSWSNCRYTVQVAYIDPCSPAFELHTDDKAEALKTWEQKARQQDRCGGEWIVELFVHPKDRAPIRKVYRRDEPDGFVYQAEYPRSSCLRRHDYMQPRLTNSNE